MANDSTGIAEVLLPLALPGPLSYQVPADLALAPGDYVEVPLGSRSMIGVVWECRPLTPTNMQLRPVTGRFDMEPMGELHRRFLDWIAAYYVEPPGNVLRMCLRVPAALGGERQQIAYVATGDEPKRMTPQRRRALDAAKDAPALRAAELAELAGVGLSVVKGLIHEGALRAVALPALRAFAEPQPSAAALTLSREQETAAQALRALVAQRGPQVALLDGVTGSGKTEVYFEAIAAALAGGQQVLLLVPEIALTQQFLSRVEERFAAEPAAWHSELRPRERERVWRGVAEGRARIIVGARSALFLPWRRLGLIVVDEEHEGAYKQEDGVPYHARDMAIVYGSIGKFPVVLSSATPSLETLVNVDRGRYRHVTLKDRHGRPELPRIDLIDMRHAKLEKGAWISPALDEAVKSALDAGEQALLFLNRRGFAPLTLCRTCGFRIECPNCSAALVEHRFRRQMQCHHCGIGWICPQ
jgi:primosomal protein N' (replication factor Y) (superfamily II helicase)